MQFIINSDPRTIPNSYKYYLRKKSQIRLWIFFWKIIRFLNEKKIFCPHRFARAYRHNNNILFSWFAYWLIFELYMRLTSQSKWVKLISLLNFLFFLIEAQTFITLHTCFSYICVLIITIIVIIIIYIQL